MSTSDPLNTRPAEMCEPDPKCAKCRGRGYTLRAEGPDPEDLEKVECRCTEKIQDCPGCTDPVRQSDDYWIENNTGDVWHIDCFHRTDREADDIRHSSDTDYHRSRGDL